MSKKAAMGHRTRISKTVLLRSPDASRSRCGRPPSAEEKRHGQKGSGSEKDGSQRRTHYTSSTSCQCQIAPFYTRFHVQWRNSHSSESSWLRLGGYRITCSYAILSRRICLSSNLGQHVRMKLVARRTAVKSHCTPTKLAQECRSGSLLPAGRHEMLLWMVFSAGGWLMPRNLNGKRNLHGRRTQCSMPRYGWDKDEMGYPGGHHGRRFLLGERRAGRIAMAHPLRRELAGRGREKTGLFG
ncbi:hypothetical protein C8R47DRAFT_167748 [Mycena vitilis]|nr:hypothetical protein C8R47DRAFT_167748 [Mycena vitilis]